MTETRSSSPIGAVISLFVVALFASCGGGVHQELSPRGDGGVAEPDLVETEDPGGLPAPNDAAVAPDAGVIAIDAGVVVEPPPVTATGFDYASSLTADFPYRDTLPQTTVPESEWFASSAYGPPAATYPGVSVPEEVDDAIAWKRERVIEVARHFLGVPYANLHIPAAGGLDCSNFTAWVYNYGFGLRFTSNTQEQAVEAGRLLKADEPLQKGDLLFIWNSGRTQIGHAAIYVDAEHLIDSTSSASPDGVGLRRFAGWYKERFAFARRVHE